MKKILLTTIAAVFALGVYAQSSTSKMDDKKMDNSNMSDSKMEGSFIGKDGKVSMIPHGEKGHSCSESCPMHSKM